MLLVALLELGADVRDLGEERGGFTLGGAERALVASVLAAHLVLVGRVAFGLGDDHIALLEQLGALL